MTTTEILGAFTWLKYQDVIDAFESIKRKLSLPPIIIGVTARNILRKPLVGEYIINGVPSPLWVKEIKEVICETASYDESEIEAGHEELSSFSASLTPVEPTGAVYYNNNYISTLYAKFNLSCYAYPTMTGPQGTIPGYMVLPVIAQAIAIRALDENDLTTHTQFQGIAYNLVNYLNSSFMKIVPKGYTGLVEVTPGVV